MAKKLLGYIISAIGIICLLISSVKEIGDLLSFIPQTWIASTTFLIISIVIVAIGLFLIVSEGSSKNKKGEEVPIYEGKKIIGYRILGK